MSRPFRLGRPRQRADDEHPVVLVYHRIARVQTDPQLLCVTPEHFAEHLHVVAQRYEPARLSDLVARSREGELRDREVALTFDDGYADNLADAKPLLERSRVPATVFVTWGYVRSGRRFWWDELEQLLLRPGRLPPELTLEIEGAPLRLELGDDAAYTSSGADARARWTILDPRDPGPRQQIYRALSARLRPVDEAVREQVLEQLRSIAEADGAGDPAPRALTIEELRRLVDGTLIEAGAHTVSHPVLARQSPDRQREEVEGSKQQLEEALARPVSSFAYPYGSPEDFDARTVALVRDAGFDYACTTVHGRLGGWIDPFRVPRITVRDWSGDELARRLSAVAA